MAAAGLRDVRWHRPRVSPEGRAHFADDYWELFEKHSPIAFLECVR